MKTTYTIYKIFRSIILSALLTVVALYVALYIAISIPYVQNKIRDIAVKELSSFLATDVTIGHLTIRPLSELVLTDVNIPTPDGSDCINVEKIGAGISLRRLLIDNRIVITYAEIIGLDGKVSQEVKDGPLNIQFLIDAFKPKDPNKPPTQFDLKLHNIVIRRSSLSYDKLWIAENGTPSLFDSNHIKIYDLKGDISIPVLKNDEFKIDVRRIALKERSGFELNSLSLIADVSPQFISLKNLNIKLPNSVISVGDINLEIEGYNSIRDRIANGFFELNVASRKVTLSDFGSFLSSLYKFDKPLSLNVNVLGNLNELEINRLNITTSDNRFSVDAEALVRSLTDMTSFSADVSKLDFHASNGEIAAVIPLLSGMSDKVKNIISNLGDITLQSTASVTNDTADFDGFIETDIGRVDLNAMLSGLSAKRIMASGNVGSSSINVGSLLDDDRFGEISFDLNADLAIAGGDIDGDVALEIPFVDYLGKRHTNIYLDATKVGESVDAVCNIDSEFINFDASVSGLIAGKDSNLSANIDIFDFQPSAFGLIKKYDDYTLSGKVLADINSFDIDKFTGNLEVNNLNFVSHDKPSLTLDNLQLISTADISNTGEILRNITLESDFVDASVIGHFKTTSIPNVVKRMLASSMPNLFPNTVIYDGLGCEDLAFDVLIKKDNELTKFFNLPVSLLTDIPISGQINELEGTADINLNIPYLQQGKDKLIRNTKLTASINSNLNRSDLDLSTVLPGKNGDIWVDFSANGLNDILSTDISWRYDRAKAYAGKVSLATTFAKSLLTDNREVNVRINPSTFQVNDSTWNIREGIILYADNKLDVSNVEVGRKDQFIRIDGKASSSSADTLAIKLRDIDLDYVFKSLNINYVTFGGMATGDLKATSVFTSTPLAFTDNLSVRKFTYNDGLLGDAIIKSHWDNDAKKVSIHADVADEGRRSATIDGGIWVTRDSLSFGLDADKVNIKFLQPFMSAFSSDVVGRASGQATLYGTFKDINLKGRLFADTIRMKVDYTNVWYAGSDSVIINPGRIEIPSFRLYDKDGHSGILTGWVNHNYFHEPSFEFKIQRASNLLCYDTNASINPDWYGTIYGNGGGSISGYPGMVSILVDMATAPKSSFTFVLSDTEAAADYQFLTFTDKRKAIIEASQPDTVPDFVKLFKKRVEEEQGRPSSFMMDLRATVNPSAKMTLIMDPIFGDKIVAYGSGALRIGYDSDSEDMTMFGKYTLERGTYNFTLQDLILKDFTISQGSNISFNGDPFLAILDIKALYRVNTNLSDLDKSFLTDRDLNRTNVPVDAVLKVTGDLQSPDISFDIELPTLTQDVTRKVKSIISTDDLMSRQIIYLLALNRFYTPEYMGSESNGGEWASVASSTLSSQISNMLGQLTDKFSVAPTFRSDKGDFSDMEVDVALSSRLLNNRLLLNGNFGYRDRTTSSTTFIGDFDIEYILSRNGNLRLKAYNHYNDQNYYLKSALTTQGIGIVYRHDFDRPFSFLRRKFNKTDLQNATTSKSTIATDSIANISSKNIVDTIINQ